MKHLFIIFVSTTLVYVSAHAMEKCTLQLYNPQEALEESLDTSEKKMLLVNTQTNETIAEAFFEKRKKFKSVTFKNEKATVHYNSNTFTPQLAGLEALSVERNYSHDQLSLVWEVIRLNALTQSQANWNTYARRLHSLITNKVLKQFEADEQKPLKVTIQKHSKRLLNCKINEKEEICSIM